MKTKLYPLLAALAFILICYGTYLGLSVGASKTTRCTINVQSSSSPVTLPVVSSANFVPGEQAHIDQLSHLADVSPVEESQTIVAVPDATHITIARLDHDHDGTVPSKDGDLGFIITDWTPFAKLWSAPPPLEATMAEVQRIFYYHVPAATCAYTLFFLNFVASIFYLWKRNEKADMLAQTSAEVGLVFATVVLITGPIWARYAWGKWWVWDPRLTTFLMLWLLYVSYLVLRRSSEKGSTAVLASALAVFAFLDVPFSYWANRLKGNHPEPITILDSRMIFTLMVNMAAFLVFAGLILWFRYELERADRRIAAVHVLRAKQGVVASIIFPAMFFFQDPEGLRRTHFMFAGYIAAWVVYAVYLLFLMGRLSRLKKEEAALRG